MAGRPDKYKSAQEVALMLLAEDVTEKAVNRTRVNARQNGKIEYAERLAEGLEIYKEALLLNKATEVNEDAADYIINIKERKGWKNDTHPRGFNIPEDFHSEEELDYMMKMDN